MVTHSLPLSSGRRLGEPNVLTDLRALEADLTETFLLRAETLLDWVEEHEMAPYGDRWGTELAVVDVPEPSPVDAPTAPTGARPDATTAPTGARPDATTAPTGASGLIHPGGPVDELGPKRIGRSQDGPVIERPVEIAGEGAPVVSDMALVDLAAALGRSVISATRLVGGITELAFRLPLIWGRVRAGDVPLWRGMRVAEKTESLSLCGAAHVDAELVSVMKSCSWAQVDRCVQAALERYPTEVDETAENTPADDRHLSIYTGDAGTDQLPTHPDSTGIGLIGVEGVLDTSDALDLEHVIRGLAEDLATAGSTDTLKVRRAKAIGILARGEAPLATGPAASAGDSGHRTPASAGQGTRGRAVTLVLHLSQAGLAGADPVGRCENTRAPVSVEQIKQWCNGARLTVRPVLDLADHQPVGSYEIPDRIRNHVRWRDLECVFPHCHRPAESCDLDHIVPYEQGGPTCACNLAPLCRRHHRVKTAGRWRYSMLSPGTFYWSSQSDAEYVVDQHGTHRLPDLTDAPSPRTLGHHRNRAVNAPVSRTRRNPEIVPAGRRGSTRSRGQEPNRSRGPDSRRTRGPDPRLFDASAPPEPT